MTRAELEAIEAREFPEPYFIEVGKPGCGQCGHNRLWDIVGPDGVAGSTSFSSVEDADDLADQLGTAYNLGIANARTDIPALVAEVRRLSACQWRPIAEIHEDYGQCVLLNLASAYMELGNNLDLDFESMGWTHFAPVPRLTHDDVAKLRTQESAK